MSHHLPSIKILGTSITTASENEILEYIFKVIEKKQEKARIVTPNPEMLVYALRSSSFQNILNQAQVSLPDGVGLTLAGSMLKTNRFTRITGVDFMEILCRESAKRGFTVGFLGGRDGVAEKTAECLVEKYPHLRVIFVGEEWKTDSKPPAQDPAGRLTTVTPRTTADRQPQAADHIDILFVAFGFPRQEEWIAKNLDSLPVSVAMGVGGAFDYISGKVPRAPKVVRNAGMEWVFRLLVQPWRLKRQLALPVFVVEVVKERFSTR